MIKRQDINFSDFKGGRFTTSNEFAITFPKMNELLLQAQLLDFKINESFGFRQYIWARADGSTSGWLCRMDHCVPRGRNIIEEHQLLASQIGGIINSWIDKPYNINKDSLIKNNNFTFCLSDSVKGIGDWMENYYSKCLENNLNAFDTDEFVTFALENNGNTTFYHKDSKQVYLYLHDGYAPFDVKLVDRQPEYTIHQLLEAKSFTDYAELLASQWLQIIK